MAFQVSPGVNVTEVSLVTSVPQTATSTGAIAGQFSWGPVGKASLISSETQLVERYGRPTANNYETFFSAANFLAYTNSLYISRAAKTSGASVDVSTSLLGNSTIIAYSSSANIAAGQSVFGAGVPETTLVLTTNNSSIANTFNANADVAVNGAITISSNPFISGETVQYTVAAGNTVISGLTNAATYFVRNSNATAIYLANTVDGTVITLVKGPTETGHTLTRINTTRVTISANTTLGSASVPSLGTVNYNEASLSYNAFANTSTLTNRSQAIVKNEDHYDTLTLPSSVKWVAKYPGELGNSLKISVVDNADQYSSTINPYAIVAGGITTNSTVIPGSAGITVALNATTANVFVANSASVSTAATANVANAIKNKLVVGDYVEVGNTSINKQKLQIKTVGSVTTTGNTSHFTLTFEEPYKLSTAFSANVVSRYWEYSTVVGKAPGISKSVSDVGSTVVDQISVVVVDEDGKISGAPDTVLETFVNLSRATDAKNQDGTAAYYKDAVNSLSKYVWFGTDRTGAASNTAINVAASTETVPLTLSMLGGRDGASESTASSADLSTAWDVFADTASVDVSLLISGRPGGVNGVQTANYIIDNIAEVRKDCVVFVSPEKSDVVNNIGSELDAVLGFRNGLRNSSYAVLDSGYKYQYDKYNDVYRWVPLNGDMAGLAARTDQVRDPWFSPAGFNRGAIKNVVKLAWNPSKAQRDILYSAEVNPVVTFPGQGTVLFGDKTLLAQGSAFDFINVRRLFIILEKTIATAANQLLFEFNDDFTRLQFKNIVEPFLREVAGRRGITDFLVVCDETNNPAEIVDAAKFVGDIYIKPARSINFIQLNFVGVGSSVEFSEIVGQF